VASRPSLVPNPPFKRENLLLNLACNVAAPALILTFLSPAGRLGPKLGLVVALAFPLGYGVADFVRRRQANFISILGFVGTLLTGGFGLMKLDAFWFAVKEAAVPFVIAIAVLLSLRTKSPLVRTLLYNDQVIDTAKVHAALEARGQVAAFERLLGRASHLLVLSFLLSAGLNFALARWLLRSPSGTPAFNAELGKMNALSWPVIVVPSTIVMFVALWILLRGIKELSGLEYEAIFHPPPEKPKGE
jgi:hypothetical protein